ncbi:bacteriocin-like protein [Chryseobacterium soli]
MKNLRKISRSELKSVKGGAELNCHCSPGDSGLPPIDTISPDAETCFKTCVCYRKGGC